jgi:tetratricopeptide (TPR) repeat protein
MTEQVHSPPPAAGGDAALGRPGLQALLVAAAALAVYVPALAAEFVYDDYALVVDNPWLRSPSWLGEVFTRQLFGFDPAAPGSVAKYRPGVHVLLMGVYAAAGTSSWAYHLVSLLLHATASLTVWALARRLLAGHTPGAALGAGLLFAVHPVHVEAVAWVSGLMDLGATAAGLGTLWLLTRRPLGPGRALAGAGLWLVALLFKEVAVVVPVMLLAWEAVEAGGRWRERAWRYGPLAAAAALYVALRLSAVGWATAHSGWEAMPPGLALLNALPLLASYARLLVLPTGLSVFHPFEPAASLAGPGVLAGAAVTLAAAAGLVLLRRRAPAAWLGLAWLLLPLLPALHLRALGESPVAERYVYLPSVGFCLLAAAAWEAWARRATAHGRRALPLLLGLAVLVAATGKTGSQVGVWQDEVSLWLNAVEAAPTAPTPLYQLGAALRRQGALEDAVPVLERAVMLRPSHALSVIELADALLQSQQPARARELLEAALGPSPENTGYHYRLGLALRDLGELEAAERSFREAARLAPREPPAWVALGEVLVRRLRPDEALVPLEKARALAPDSPDVHRALASAWRAMGNEAQARKHEAAAREGAAAP